MADFVCVANVDDVPDPGKLTVEIEERFVVVVRTQGQIFCIDDVCTHDGGPLGEGPVDGMHICCPRHGARFDISTGKPITMPATEPTVVHEVQIVDGEIRVRLNDA